MDLNYLLLWMVGFSAAASLVQYLRMGIPGTTGRKLACVILLAVAGAGYFLLPKTGGYIALAFWCVLMLAPGLAARRLKRLVAAEDFGKAAATARWLSWIFPLDDWRVMAGIYDASHQAKIGSLDAAGAILERYRHLKTPQARNAIAQLYKLQNRWDELLAWLEADISPRELEMDPGLLLLQLRAWGETGQLDRLLAGFQAFDTHYHNFPNYRDAARLYLLAFFGRVELLTALFDGPLANYPASIRERWLATARAQNYAAPADGGQAAAVFARLQGELVQEKRYGVAAPSVLTRPLLTYALIASNVLVFAVEMAKGGATDDQVLISLGALSPANFTGADWWRLIAATFLHFGILHIAMNMLGLYVLGPFVERILRGWRYLVCYLGAGIGSMAVVVLVNRLGFLNYDMVVGASGSIMGLVGATAAICLRDSRILKTRASVERLKRAGYIILVQVIFDASTPQVSMTAHLGGAVSGFLLAFLLLSAGL